MQYTKDPSEYGFEHFSADEFKCKCGKCGGWGYSPDDLSRTNLDENDREKVGKGISVKLLTGLEKLREITGASIQINSGYRCPYYNMSKGYAAKSRHMVGQAADIQISGFDSVQLFKKALMVPEFEEGGIGWYPSFIHVDVRQESGWGRASWGGETKTKDTEFDSYGDKLREMFTIGETKYSGLTPDIRTTLDNMKSLLNNYETAANRTGTSPAAITVSAKSSSPDVSKSATVKLITSFLRSSVDYEYLIRRWKHRAGRLSGPFNPHILVGFPIEIRENYDELLPSKGNSKETSEKGEVLLKGFVEGATHILDCKNNQANTTLQLSMMRTAGGSEYNEDDHLREELEDSLGGGIYNTLRNNSEELYDKLDASTKERSLATEEDIKKLFINQKNTKFHQKYYGSGMEPGSFDFLDSSSSQGGHEFVKDVLHRRSIPIENLISILNRRDAFSYDKG